LLCSPLIAGFVVCKAIEVFIEMNCFYYILFSFLLTFSSAQLSAQFVTGKVVEESGCLPVQVTNFEHLEKLSQQWQVPLALLQKVNKEGSFVSGNTAWVNFPLSGKLLLAPCEGCSTMLHKVQQGEGLYRIGLFYGSGKAADLKKMNNLRNDALQPGEELIVGYLPVSEIEGGLADVASGNAGSSKQVTEKSDSAQQPITAEALPAGDKVEKPVADPVVRPVLTFKGEGIFADEFKPDAEKVVKRNMKASTFKSESGWEDGRFYLLSNNIRSGVVVRVLNPTNGSYLYAKVVGPMPDIKQNIGLQLRLSNAGAAMLGFLHDEEVHELDLTY
jgi:LysM repeat protein